MRKCDVVLCDVDGVINIFADEGFVWHDIQDKRIIVDGKPSALFSFSPTVAKELNTLAGGFPFLWLTSWNEKTRFLTDLGFPAANFLPVTVGEETESKIAHVAKLAETQRVLWIDDFAEEWRGMLPTEVLKNVVSLQTDHKQGITPDDLITIKNRCGF
jgi:hypothetical protein